MLRAVPPRSSSKIYSAHFVAASGISLTFATTSLTITRSMPPTALRAPILPARWRARFRSDPHPPGKTTVSHPHPSPTPFDKEQSGARFCFSEIVRPKRPMTVPKKTHRLLIMKYLCIFLPFHDTKISLALCTSSDCLRNIYRGNTFHGSSLSDSMTEC